MKLVGSKSNRKGFGSKVTVTAAGKAFAQMNDRVSEDLSNRVILLYFGLGDAGAVEKIEIVWPSESTQKITSSIMGKVYSIEEE